MKTKIIATIGPSSDSYEVIYKLIEAGMNIARMNFSHCKYEEYIARKKHIRKASAKLKKEVQILQDLQGPRIRVGEMPKEGRILKEGELVTFTTDGKKNGDAIHVDDPYLHLDIKPGEPIFLANGEMELIVKKKKGSEIYAEVVRGGILYSRKGVNVPHTKLTNSGLTKKDIKDIRFGLKQSVDYIAISFVQSAHDILRARKIIGTKARIIAKIETGMALRNIDAIIQAADGIMIARGDLGIEVPYEKLPFIQKSLIRHSAWYHKPSITATQMLISMINHDRPTRAEVSDIANAVWDGTDAVMLSEETAEGKYPIRSLKTMAKVVKQAEETKNQANWL